MYAVLQGKTPAILTSYGDEGMDVRGRVVDLTMKWPQRC